ncbi:MAG TPA: hypothetical protein PKW63_05010, partial [Vicinamibacterales bacterium]|nr:hypothetical protein [Vicinamibacterales bacterium]
DNDQRISASSSTTSTVLGIIRRLMGRISCTFGRLLRHFFGKSGLDRDPDSNYIQGLGHD